MGDFDDPRNDLIEDRSVGAVERDVDWRGIGVDLIRAIPSFLRVFVDREESSLRKRLLKADLIIREREAFGSVPERITWSEMTRKLTRVCVIFGDTDMGKSNVMRVCSIDSLRSGRNVLWVDHEADSEKPPPDYVPVVHELPDEKRLNELCSMGPLDIYIDDAWEWLDVQEYRDKRAKEFTKFARRLAHRDAKIWLASQNLSIINLSMYRSGAACVLAVEQSEMNLASTRDEFSDIARRLACVYGVGQVAGYFGAGVYVCGVPYVPWNLKQLKDDLEAEGSTVTLEAVLERSRELHGV